MEYRKNNISLQCVELSDTVSRLSIAVISSTSFQNEFVYFFRPVFYLIYCYFLFYFVVLSTWSVINKIVFVHEYFFTRLELP